MMTQDQKDTLQLQSCFDGKIWAEQFTKIAAKQGLTIDEEWMHTWFANALMAGYDFHARQQAKKSMWVRFKDSCRDRHWRRIILETDRRKAQEQIA